MSSTALPPIQTKMVPSISSISAIDDDDDDYEDIELYRHDLYYVHCHQIIPKSQESVFQQMLKQNVAYNQNNPLHDKSMYDEDYDEDTQEHKDIVEDDVIFDNKPNGSSKKGQKLPLAPPPTAVHTPLYNTTIRNNGELSIGYNTGSSTKPKRTDIATVKTKLERHSKKLERENMEKLLKEHKNAEDPDGDDDDDSLKEQPSPSQHFGGQRSIMSLMQSNGKNVQPMMPMVPVNTPHGNKLLQDMTASAITQPSMPGNVITENEEDTIINHGERDRPTFGFTPSVISQHSNPILLGGIEDEDDDDDDDRMKVPTPSTTKSDDFYKKNAYNISYYCIPQHIDGGILSSSVFLPYKQWCESSIIRYTDQAGECLDAMKKESNMLEHLHRTTITRSPLEDLYDDDGDDDDDDDPDGIVKGLKVMGGGGLLLGYDANNDNDDLRRKRDIHLKKLSQIDENLADVRDKIRKMFRVQQHIIFIQQQYDTHIDRIRDDGT